jgi:succinate dehydrogenase / fumarate reductase membrane anchor subunit
MGNGTKIGKVRGLGSSGHGSHHWLLQRSTAAGNFLAGIFLAVSFIALPDMSYETLTAWFAKPFPATVTVLFVVSTFWHARLGLQVLIEDYVHTDGNKFTLLLVLNLLTFVGATFGVVSVAQLVTQQESLTQADVQQQITQTLQGMMGGAGAPGAGGPQ